MQNYLTLHRVPTELRLVQSWHTVENKIENKKSALYSTSYSSEVTLTNLKTSQISEQM
jgi:hypothetical protein